MRKELGTFVLLVVLCIALAILNPSFLASANLHVGRLLNYWPDAPKRDPLGGPECAPVPTPVARTTHRFLADSRRQITQLEAATGEWNGTLIDVGAEALVDRVARHRLDAPPRDIVLELNTARATRPIYWPGSIVPPRKALSPENSKELFAR